MSPTDVKQALDRLNALEHELARLKRDLLKIRAEGDRNRRVGTLYGTVGGGDITDEVVQEAKDSLFRHGKEA